MMSSSLIVLTGFIAWTLLLLIVMEVIRSVMVVRGTVPANGFSPDNAGLSPFMQRLARAHANCIEGLPIFGGLLLVAVVADLAHLTDPLAWVFLIARIVQSLIHLCSISPVAVTLRFSAFAVQLLIATYWAFVLLLALTGPAG